MNWLYEGESGGCEFRMEDSNNFPGKQIRYIIFRELLVWCILIEN